MRIIGKRRGYCAIAMAVMITSLFTACAGTSDAEATVLAMPGTAQACLDSRLYAVGTRMDLVYRSTSGGAVLMLIAVCSGSTTTKGNCR